MSITYNWLLLAIVLLALVHSFVSHVQSLFPTTFMRLYWSAPYMWSHTPSECRKLSCTTVLTRTPLPFFFEVYKLDLHCPEVVQQYVSQKYRKLVTQEWGLNNNNNHHHHHHYYRYSQHQHHSYYSYHHWQHHHQCSHVRTPARDKSYIRMYSFE